MNGKPYRRIVEHYEGCLARHGDTHLGVDWPRIEDVDKRHAVMLGVVRGDAAETVTLLDFGCGLGHFLEYLLGRQAHHIRYTGLDLSDRFIALCRSKFPGVAFECLDVLDPCIDIEEFDYVVMNGVFTEKRDLSQEEMWAYFQAVLRRLWRKTRVGMAFNVMSKQVDWERDDLFHVSFDMLASFLRAELSRHLVFRHDYGLYEYTTYVYRESRRWPG
jgi:SAM-dependent methyltransferase